MGFLMFVNVFCLVFIAAISLEKEPTTKNSI